MVSKITQRYFRIVPKERFFQGDIIQNLEIKKLVENDVFVYIMQYGVIVSQDCDLEQDHIKQHPTSDKTLQTILVLPAYIASDFKSGTHIPRIQGHRYNTEQYKRIVHHQDARFYHLPLNTNLQIPELVIDFKHQYSIDRDYLYLNLDKIYLASFSELFREHLTNRYCNFLGRIGLPEL